MTDPLYLNSDNVSGRVLAQADVAPGEDSVSLSFTVEDYVSCIQFRVQTDSALTFTGIHLLSQSGLYQDPYLYAGLLLLASALLLLYRRRHTSAAGLCGSLEHSSHELPLDPEGA